MTAWGLEVYKRYLITLDNDQFCQPNCFGQRIPIMVSIKISSIMEFV